MLIKYYLSVSAVPFVLFSLSLILDYGPRSERSEPRALFLVHLVVITFSEKIQLISACYVVTVKMFGKVHVCPPPPPNPPLNSTVGMLLRSQFPIKNLIQQLHFYALYSQFVQIIRSVDASLHRVKETTSKTL